MTATPDVRLDDLDNLESSTETGCAAVGTGWRGTSPASAERGDTTRTVTPEQVDHAVAQLRECRGRAAAEQMQAVLRALDLTVVPRSESQR